ncbi:hypothetical protein [Citrobacter koseri]|uniref:hypothetical protein n=1 Tax=Citrobacter koseri TaxID=545 RepID=UPI003967CA5B
MIDKYRLEDLRRESGEKGELARWVIQLQVELDRERRKGVDSAELQERSKTDSNSHPAHCPLSNYRLHQIRLTLSKAAAQSDGGNIGYAMSDAVKAFDELLALRGAKPIGITDRSEIECLKRGEMANVMPPDYKGVDAGDEVFVYTTPPAPVVMRRYIFEKWWESQNGTPLDGWDSLRTTDGYCDDGIDGQFDAWNACRAAMLNGGKS